MTSAARRRERGEAQATAERTPAILSGRRSRVKRPRRSERRLAVWLRFASRTGRPNRFVGNKLAVVFVRRPRGHTNSQRGGPAARHSSCVRGTAAPRRAGRTWRGKPRSPGARPSVAGEIGGPHRRGSFRHGPVARLAWQVAGSSDESPCRAGDGASGSGLAGRLLVRQALTHSSGIPGFALHSTPRD